MRIQVQKVKYSCIKAVQQAKKGGIFMLDVAVARARILENLKTCGQEIVPLSQACGRVLAQPVHARTANPPVSVSAMDGYAAKAEDALEGAVLRIVGEAPAGHPCAVTVQKGECVRLFTGAQIPAGADTIIIQENVQREGDHAKLTAPARQGQYIRQQGQDFQKNDELLPAGRRLGPRDIGLAAAGGHVWLTVSRRPRVGILATGDEIILPGDPAPADGIFNSATFMVAALLQQQGAETIMLPIARDNMESLTTQFRQAASLDMLVSIGGASVGDYDLVRPALAEIGLQQDFWKIAMRPGKPLMSGRLGNTPIIGLPGNPVAAMVCSIVFVTPALHALMGLPVGDELQTEPAILGCDVKENDARQDFLRATLAPSPQGAVPVATPFSRQDSAQLNILKQSQVLVMRAPFAPAQKAGTPCQIIRLP
ncbi:molybdopterin molybdotransferase MoeA [Acetobacter pasteurianus]|uniref:molybdopterin molybdotransferase MoeA n=1 Tax=Acetobacter pasteurianus TaxID=438 RepID=UPI003D0E29CE